MKLTELMSAFSHARRLYEIIQRHDPSHTLRKYPNAKKLFAAMDDLEASEFLRYLERMDNLVNAIGEDYELDLKKKKKARRS